ncbi:hypothetical protein BV25DRAFT_353001 [Artomyces pyxidatus]|uniref:Uncharacterized protein n=1 Tax=Artomyces pyxidatus TaxID=48021 RepID=A0ACB8SEX5_9AGAM|nr:hypothetical protein BV25DRAFT_353001 [Artomyces pyxidatus]
MSLADRPSDLPKRRVARLVPLCNDATMKAYLNEYCTVAGDGQSRSASFVKVFNHALQKLQDLTGHPLREAHVAQYLFHASSLKPDVVLVPLAAARRAADRNKNANGKDFAALSALSFEPPDILLSIELKGKLSTLACRLPSTPPPSCGGR